MDLIWMYMLTGILTGVMVGVGATLYLHQGMRRKLKRLEKLEAEYKAYRKDVTKHFVGTAGLVNQLTQSYKAVYDHLEEGAYALVDREELQRELGEQSPQLAGFLASPQLTGGEPLSQDSPEVVAKASNDHGEAA